MARIHVPAILGFYDDANDLLEVATAARHRGFKNLDTYSPYPIHGMEEAIDAKPSWVIISARLGLIGGAFAGFMLQSWTSAVDWPVNIGGKPFVSWPAWIPVTFEAGVLLAAFCNLISMFIACGLYPRPKTIILSKRVTDDRFLLVIPAASELQEREIVEFLDEHKALKIKIVDGVDAENGRVLFRAAPALTGEATV